MVQSVCKSLYLFFSNKTKIVFESHSQSDYSVFRLNKYQHNALPSISCICFPMCSNSNTEINKTIIL